MSMDANKAMELYDARSNGLSFNQIAKDTGLTRATVQRQVRKLEEQYGPALKEEDMPPNLKRSQQNANQRRRWKITELRRLIDTVNEISPPGDDTYVEWKEVQRVGGFVGSRDVVAIRKKWEYHIRGREIVERDGRWVIADTPHEPEEKPTPAPEAPVRKVTTKSFLWGLYTVTHEE